jgi:hypothetical protein
MSHIKNSKLIKRQNKANRSEKVFNGSVCSPLANDNTNNNYSCMSGNHLIELAHLWNRRHPEHKITSMTPRSIWTFFKNVFSNSCINEKCWIKKNMFGSGIDDNLLNELNDLYAPDAPKSWKDNPRTWLNSLDILSVMNQYEKKYSCFQFIGPSPIDFDKDVNSQQSYNNSNNNNNNTKKKECVWNELCNFNIVKLNNQGIKTKIGIIFNTDPHNEPGEHWVSLFIDIKHRLIVYFDSAGSSIPLEVKVFVERIQKQIYDNKQEKYDFIENKIEHQKKNTECGMYSLYFIIQMLKTGNYKQFTETQQTITDEEMEKLREEYFNIE